MNDLFEAETIQANFAIQTGQAWEKLKREIQHYQHYRQGSPFQKHMGRIAKLRIETLLESVSLA